MISAQELYEADLEEYFDSPGMPPWRHLPQGLTRQFYVRQAQWLNYLFHWVKSDDFGPLEGPPSFTEPQQYYDADIKDFLEVAKLSHMGPGGLVWPNASEWDRIRYTAIAKRINYGR